VALLASKGLAARALLDPLGVTEETLADDLARVSVFKLAKLTTVAEKLSGDVDLGLHLAERSEFDTFGAISLLAVRSATLGDAFQRVKRYTRFILGSEGYDLRVVGNVASLSAPRAAFAPVDRHAAEWILGVPHVYSKAVSVRPWAPIEVTFVHPMPSRTTEHARIFGCPVRFGAEVDAIRFPADLLESPSRLRSDELAETLEATSRSLELEATPENDIAARVRVLVWEKLKSGDTSIESIANELKMSSRTLQRSLGNAKTSHRELVDEVRALFARQLLARGDVRLIEVAMLLGFSDQTAFQKAFVRWTGVTPAKYRKNPTN